MCHRTLVVLVGVGKKVMEWKLTFRPYLSAWRKHVNGVNWHSKQVCVGRRPQKSPPWMYTVPFIPSNGPRHRNVFALCLCWIHASVFISTVSTDCSLWLKVQLVWLSICYAYRIIIHLPCLILQSSVCLCHWLPGLRPCKARDFTVYVSTATQHQHCTDRSCFFVLCFIVLHRYCVFLTTLHQARDWTRVSYIKRTLHLGEYVLSWALTPESHSSLCHWPSHMFSSVQSLCRVQLFATPWTAACQVSLSINNSWSLLKLMSIESVMPSNHLILCCPLLLLPSIFPNIRVFSSESVLWIRWPKYWSFTCSISPSNEYSGLISCRIDWFDFLVVQGTLRVFSNTIVKKHQFFSVQLSL